MPDQVRHDASATFCGVVNFKNSTIFTRNAAPLMIRGSNTAFNYFQRFLDLFIIWVITILAGDRLIPAELVTFVWIYCSLLSMVIFSLFSVYSPWTRSSMMQQVWVLAVAWFAVLVAFKLIILLLSGKEQLAVFSPLGLFSSAGFNFWVFFMFCALAAVRLALHGFLLIMRSKGYFQQPAIIIGATETGQKLAQYLMTNPFLGVDVYGFFDDTLPVGIDVKVAPGHRAKVLGGIDDCNVYMRNEEINLAFLTLPMREEKTITQIVCRLGTSGHSILMVQDLFSYAIQKARPQHLGELQIMNFCLFPRWKRVFDIVFSLIVLLVTLPLWLIIILAIKAEDGGPIVFRHARVMEGGKRFHCLKFRSMHPDAQERLEYLLHKDPLLQEEWQARFKLKNDPRVTRVGKIMRRFGVDELPQLLNVLSGEMSIVGARPVIPEELEKYYREATLTYCAMKPGITGPWQVVSHNEALNYVDRVEMDRRYILQCSIWNDLGIILKTIWRIIFAKGT